MQSPSEHDTREKFDSLTHSGLAYLRKSIAELHGETEIDFSVVHFAIGVELLLKARLFGEHWRLVFSDPHDATWEALESGNFTTPQASELHKLLRNATGDKLSEKYSDKQGENGNRQWFFRQVFEHRNQAIHFLPHPDKERTATEQFRAWYRLKELLLGKWHGHFENHQDAIEDLDKLIRQHKKYIDARFKDLERDKKFVRLTENNRVTQCPCCKLDSCAIHENAGVDERRCEICDDESVVVQAICGAWCDEGELEFLAQDAQEPQISWEWECQCNQCSGENQRWFWIPLQGWRNEEVATKILRRGIEDGFEDMSELKHCGEVQFTWLDFATSLLGNLIACRECDHEASATVFKGVPGLICLNCRERNLEKFECNWCNGSFASTSAGASQLDSCLSGCGFQGCQGQPD